MKTLLKNYWPNIAIFIFEVVLFSSNYKPGTFLVGWDNVYPELNFSENITRGLFSVWQQYRGLGVIDGMAHAALLPHTLTVWLLSLFFPLNFLRYIIQFSLHFLGGIGMYLLLRYFLSSHTTYNPATSLRQNSEQALRARPQLLSLLGALFYMFNLITIQMFYTPLELFSYHFAFLPLLILATLQFLEHGSRKRLLWFVFLSFLSLPQAHVPSIFLVYAGVLAAVVSCRIITSHTPAKTTRLATILAAATLAINAYWVLPYIYTTLHASKTIVESKINQMSTDNVVLRNKVFGDFTSVALLRGFTLDFVDFQPTGENAYMLQQWRSHSHSLPIYVVSVLAFVCVAVGLFTVVAQREKRFYPIVVIFAGSFLMLGNNIPILSLFSDLIVRHIPLFYNVFRFTFTKFSIVYAFSYSILLVLGIEHLMVFVQQKILKKAVAIYCIALILLYSLPAFFGGFFYDNLRVAIPKEYFDVIDFFSSTKNVRVATFPQPSYWGWVYYAWGARGSGFLWYGLPTATLDGAFYPWSRQNENYYWEMSRAVYAKDPQLFEKVLDKYQVDYILVDYNLQSPFTPKALYTDQIVNLIGQIKHTDPPKVFGNLVVYKVNRDLPQNSYVYMLQDAPIVSPDYKWNNYDRAFEEYGDYVTYLESSINNQQLTINNYVFYPFRSLFTGRSQQDLEFKVRDEKDWFIFENTLPAYWKNTDLVVPVFRAEEVLELDVKDLSSTIAKFPQILINGREILYSKENREPEVIHFDMLPKGAIQVRVPKIFGPYSLDTDADAQLFRKEPENCEKFNKGFFKLEKKDDDGEYLRFTSIGSNNCLDVHFDQAFQRLGYITTVTARNIEGSSLLFNVFNNANSRPELETYLPQLRSINKSIRLAKSYFVIPPLDNYGFGYNLHFDNISVGKIKTVNDLRKVTINPIPYRFLTGLKIITQSSNNPTRLRQGFGGQVTQTKISAESLNVTHPNPSYYEVLLNNETMQQLNNRTLVLSQSFDSGWHAYSINNKQSTINNIFTRLFPFIFGKELKEHVLVNNWSNGWQLPPTTHLPAGKAGNSSPTTIVIIYLPQYLQYLGFAMLGGFFVYLILRFKQMRRSDRQPQNDLF